MTKTIRVLHLVDHETELEEIQQRVNAWQRETFPGTNRLASLRGIGEELGEMTRHLLKGTEGVRGTPEEHVYGRNKEFADVVIFLLNFAGACNVVASKIYADQVTALYQHHVMVKGDQEEFIPCVTDAEAESHLWFTYGLLWMSHAQESDDEILLSIGSMLMYLEEFARLSNIDFMETLKARVEQVTKRTRDGYYATEKAGE